MEEKLLELIENEDACNPYTDERLAELLGIRRELVVELRKKKNIPNSRTRLKPALIKEIQKHLKSAPDMSDRTLTEQLQMAGFSASRYLIHEIREEVEKDIKASSDNVKETSLKAIESVEEDTFSNMIGYKAGLKAQIHQAKAAIAYPPNGLHVMIIGPSGTGKTLLAENMYNYAVHQGILPKSAPMIFFNCADYAENPQLLYSQLFGYVKGAFSGANDTRNGLVGEADGGVLFLDEVHRLSGEGQEMLFYLIDKGAYRRLGDAGPARHVNVRIIVATTSSPESALLPTFRRRIPIVISMPALTDRPIAERYELLEHIFEVEQQKFGRHLLVDAEAVKLLLGYNCAGNVGQLQSSIQMCCANAFLESANKKENTVHITTLLLKQLLDIDIDELSYSVGDNYNHRMVFPKGEIDIVEDARVAENVHTVLEGLKPKLTPYTEEFEATISDCVTKLLNGQEDQLAITQLADENALSARALAKEFIREFNCGMEQQLSLSAIDILALYFHTFSVRFLNGRIRIIIMTHGNTGKAMAEVVNYVLKDDNTLGFTMGWDESIEQVMERAIEVVKAADEGRGCLLLVDMGSCASFAPEISMRTGVNVRCVSRVDTLMALDAASKASINDERSLDSLADALEAGRLHVGYTENRYQTGKPPAILTVCMTGEGSAHRIRGFLEATISRSDKIKLVELGILNRESLTESVRKICQQYDIVATVGTINPELPGVPFLSKDFIFSSQGTMTLDSLLKDYFEESMSLTDLLKPDLIMCDADFSDKIEAIDGMCEALMTEKYVEPEFLLSVYKRENVGFTALKEGIAIPHGVPELVIKPAICVAKLKKPIEWVADCVVDYVFLFALTEDCKRYVQSFYDIISDEKALNTLKKAASKEEIFKSLK